MTKEEQKIISDNISLTSAILDNVYDSLGIQIMALIRERDKITEMLACLKTKRPASAEKEGER